MKEFGLAKRYARALVSLGRETQLLPQFQKGLAEFHGALQHSPSLLKVLSAFEFSKEKRRALVLSLTKHFSINPLLENFFQILIDRNRIQFFPQIYKSFEDEILSLNQEVVAHVKVADPITTQESLAELKKSLEKIVGKKVNLNLQSDRELIGGIQVRIGDTIYDGSIKGQLEKIKETLLQ